MKKEKDGLNLTKENKKYLLLGAMLFVGFVFGVIFHNDVPLIVQGQTKMVSFTLTEEQIYTDDIAYVCGTESFEFTGADSIKTGVNCFYRESKLDNKVFCLCEYGLIR